MQLLATQQKRKKVHKYKKKAAADWIFFPTKKESNEHGLKQLCTLKLYCGYCPDRYTYCSDCFGEKAIFLSSVKSIILL